MITLGSANHCVEFGRAAAIMHCHLLSCACWAWSRWRPCCCCFFKLLAWSRGGLRLLDVGAFTCLRCFADLCNCHLPVLWAMFLFLIFLTFFSLATYWKLVAEGMCLKMCPAFIANCHGIPFCSLCLFPICCTGFPFFLSAQKLENGIPPDAKLMNIVSKYFFFSFFISDDSHLRGSLHTAYNSL